MKSAIEKRPYISAYPLKAFNLSEEEYEAELRLWSSGNSKPVSDLHILPMVNPYREKDFINNSAEPDNTK